jgi:hypothetical protein
LTRRLFRATAIKWQRMRQRCRTTPSRSLGVDIPPLFIAIFPSSTSSEDKQMRTVSFLFLPLSCGKNPPLGQRR